MRGEPVLPSEFVSLFDSSLSNQSNNQQLRKHFTLYHELDHHCEKFDENLLDFHRRLTQTVTDVRDLLHGTYQRFPNLEKIPQLIDVETNEQFEDISNNITTSQEEIMDIFDRATSENEPLPEPRPPSIVRRQQTNNN